MRLKTALAIVAAAFASALGAQGSAGPPLLPPQHSAAIAAEISGAAAKRTVEALSLHHRMRASEGIEAAAELIRKRLTEHGLSEVEMIRLPADGKIFYGTQRSRPAWNASFAELWEQKEENGRWRDSERIASWAEQPISLAQDSLSGRAEAELVDIGPGTSPSHYAGKDVRGKLVLTSSQPEAVAALAVAERGAAGIVSWAQNQQQAWHGEDESLVRWTHLSTWADPTFAFSVSPARARSWQSRLARGEKVRLRALVEAARSPGAYTIPTGVIPGRDRNSEIVFSCHLDHPSPGANDNASGCAGILEVARSLNRLIREGKLPQPQRTLRFIWPPEIEGTIALLAGRPEFGRRTLATIHFDMIGGNTEITKSILKVEGSPPSLPSFVNDVAVSFGRFVNAQSLLFAATGAASFPLVDLEGDKRALQAQVGGFSEGSDHQVWAEGSWRIPVIYLADWPDRYIHTQRDVPANIDATKLKRAIFIGAASAWQLANLDSGGMAGLWSIMRVEQLNRTADTMRRIDALAGAGREEIHNILRQHSEYEAGMIASLERFAPVPAAVAAEARQFQAASQRLLGRAPPRARAQAAHAIVYERVAALQGPMNGFGYSWFDDHLKKAKLDRPRLLARQPQAGGASFGYEALNLVNGRRSIQEIRDYLAATSGPVPVEEVAEYLAVLQRLGVVQPARR